MTDTAIEKHNGNGEHVLSGVPFEQDTLRLAKAMAQSGFFKDSPDVAKAVVKILAGRELGFGVVASMTGIYIVDGKVTLSANLMAAAIKRSGRYNYRVRTLTNEACSVEFFEGKESIGVSDFTLEDATRANLAGKGTWKSYPRNLLFARAMSNGARFFCADVFGGPTYTPEELGANVDQDGEPVDFQQVNRPSLARTAAEIAPSRQSPPEGTQEPAEGEYTADEPVAPGTKTSNRGEEFAAEFADVLTPPDDSEEPVGGSPLREECRAVMARMRKINPQTKVTLPDDDAHDEHWHRFLDQYAPAVEAAERRGQQAARPGR